MEIQDERHTEIFHTLEKIERLNKAIHFHKAMEAETDHFSIDQYMLLKGELTEQLLQLLKEMGLHLQVVRG